MLQAYCNHCGYGLDDYRAFLKDGIVSKALSETEVFKAYCELFDSTDRNAMKGVCDAAKDIRNRFRARSKTQIFRRQDDTWKKAEKEKALRNFIISIEWEKVYIFLLAYTVNTPVLIVKSPTTTAAIKKFLGYEWSDSKGNEGIEYLHLSKSKSENDDEGNDDDTVQQIRGINGIRTPLFNPDNLCDHAKINTLIRQNFLGEDVVVPEDLSEVISQARLVDMIDFKRTAFDKAIKTSAFTNVEFVHSKWPLASLGSLVSAPPQYGANVAATEGNPLSDYRYIRITDITDAGELNNDWKTAERIDEQYILTDKDLLFARSGATAGKPFLYREKYGKALFAGYLIRFRFTEKVMPEYVFQFCLAEEYRKWVLAHRGGTAQPNINAQQYSSFKLPLAPPDVQEKVVIECKAIDKEVEEAKLKISEAESEIEQAFSNATRNAIKTLRLGDSRIFNISIGRRVISNEIVKDGQYKVVSANVHDEFGRINHSVLDDFSVPSVLWGIDGDWMVNYIEKDILYAPTDHCGVIRVIDETEILPKYLTYPLLKVGEQERFSRANRASTERVRALAITVPDINTQKNVVTKVLECEAKIANAQAIINSSAERKQAILDKYLK